MSLRKSHESKLELKVCQGPSKKGLNNSTIKIIKIFYPTCKTRSKSRKLIGDVKDLIGALSKHSNTVFSLCMPFCPPNSRVVNLAHTQRS